METQSPDQIISARINEFTQSIQMLLNAGYDRPALIVLYTAIDIFASLRRLETEDDTRGTYFKKWVDDYLIAGSQRPFTSEDLWGARCGLLHTHTPSSKVSREGKAHQLHYYRGNPPPDLKQRMALLVAQGKQFVDLDVLYADFIEALDHFLADIHSDPGLNRRVLHHSAKLFGGWSSAD